MTNRWGIATVENGSVVGVTGHFRLRLLARRRLEALTVGQDAGSYRRYKIVRRSRASGTDWGTQLTLDEFSQNRGAPA